MSDFIIKLGLLLAVLSPVQAQTNPQPACSSTVRFDFEKKAAMADGLAGKLELRAAEEQAEPLVLPAKLGTPVTAKLPCASTWEVTAVFPDTWGPRTTIVAGGPSETLASRIRLWPLGRIAGSVKVSGKDEKLPKSLSVTTLAPRTPAQREIPKGFLDCPLDKDGRWQCPPLPASTFDLVISAEGFIPQYRWELGVPAGKTADMGPVELKRGASVAGWVGVEEGKIADSCKARLVPLMSPGGGRIGEKVAQMALEAPVRKDGFFQLAGVSPGTYTLEIRQPGFAVTAIQPIEVWPRLETFLREPVILKRPLRVDLSLSPPLDWLGRPWQVLVFNASEESASFAGDAVFNGTADEQGLVSIPDQPPGRYRVFVSDALDNRIATKTFRIAGPEDASQTIQLELLTVQGKVRLGKEPLAATLWFGGRFGAAAVRMESDDDGTFHGILPHADWWRVDISSAEPRFDARTKVKVVADHRDSAEVEIVLPDTRVFGKVLDDTGRPAPGASVGFSTAEGEQMTETDDAGRFELRGLVAGMAIAAATHRTAREAWTSDRVPLFVQEGDDVGPIELRMRKSKKVTGMVQSTRGPVPGAGISVLPLSPTVLFRQLARTEPDGTFSVQIPAPTLTAAAVVSPPGHALRAFLLRLDEPNMPVLTVDQQGGDLELLLPEKPPDAEKDEVSLWVFQNGLPITTDILIRWVLGHGRDATDQGRLAVPELAPGEYRACLVAHAVLAQWQDSGWMAPYAKCAAGQLSAGGSLQLDLSKP